jgi:hypothetical protein
MSPVNSNQKFPHIPFASANNKGRVVLPAHSLWQGICTSTLSRISEEWWSNKFESSNLEVSEMKKATQKRIVATLILSIVILGQAFGAFSAAAQRRLYRPQNRANRVLIGNAIGLNRRNRGWNNRRMLTIRTRRRVPRTVILRSVPTIPVTSLRNRRQYRSY